MSHIALHSIATAAINDVSHAGSRERVEQLRPDAPVTMAPAVAPAGVRAGPGDVPVRGGAAAATPDAPRVLVEPPSGEVFDGGPREGPLEQLEPLRPPFEPPATPVGVAVVVDEPLDRHVTVRAVDVLRAGFPRAPLRGSQK